MADLPERARARRLTSAGVELGADSAFLTKTRLANRYSTSRQIRTSLMTVAALDAHNLGFAVGALMLPLIGLILLIVSLLERARSQKQPPPMKGYIVSHADDQADTAGIR